VKVADDHAVDRRWDAIMHIAVAGGQIDTANGTGTAVPKMICRDILKGDFDGAFKSLHRLLQKSTDDERTNPWFAFAGLVTSEILYLKKMEGS
jgi:hypothetical protein